MPGYGRRMPGVGLRGLRAGVIMGTVIIGPSQRTPRSRPSIPSVPRNRTSGPLNGRPGTGRCAARRTLRPGSADTPARARTGGAQAEADPVGKTAAASSASRRAIRSSTPRWRPSRRAGTRSASVRDDLEFEGWPAPKRLAPRAVALAATAFRDGEEAGEGKLMLLYDPAGQDGWTGTFRIVIQVQADVEEEMAADPLLGEVGWSWLTDALDLHAPGYAAPSGTVTRVITEGYGAKSDDLPATGFELRASWCPADDGDDDGDELEAEIGGAVAAWCELLASAAGLPAAARSRSATGA